MKIIDVTIICLLAVILVVVDLLLSFIPFVQLSFLLIVLYSKTLRFRDVTIIVMIYVALDCLFIGGIVPLYLLSMFFGYMFIPITLNTVFKGINKSTHLALLSLIFCPFYALMFLISTSILTDVKILAYLISDIPFTLMLIVSSIITINWLYDPLKKTIDSLLNEVKNKT